MSIQQIILGRQLLDNNLNLPNSPNENDSNADDEYVIDEFETTPPISTFTVGFVISKLTEVNSTMIKEDKEASPIVKVWAREEFQDQLGVSYSARCDIRCH